MVQVLKNFSTWALVLLFYGMDITSGFPQIVWKNPLDETFPVVEGRLTPMADYARFPKEMEGKVRPAWQLSRRSAGLSIVFGTDASTVHVRYSVTGNLQIFNYNHVRLFKGPIQQQQNFNHVQWHCSGLI